MALGKRKRVSLSVYAEGKYRELNGLYFIPGSKFAVEHLRKKTRSDKPEEVQGKTELNPTSIGNPSGSSLGSVVEKSLQREMKLTQEALDKIQCNVVICYLIVLAKLVLLSLGYIMTSLRYHIISAVERSTGSVT